MLFELFNSVSLIFIITALLAGVILSVILIKHRIVALLVFVWLSIQAVISLRGVYSSFPKAIPPTIVLFGILPMLIAILFMLLSPSGKRLINTLSLKKLTYLHIIRIPVEIGLYYLFLEKAIPQSMTFDGQNFDVIAGITAPFVAYYSDKIGRKGLLIWNFVCLALLLNIVVTAFLSAPSPFQQLAFDQPNIAILYFPFSWLPTFIVPVVLFAHLASIRKLLKQAKN